MSFNGNNAFTNLIVKNDRFSKKKKKTAFVNLLFKNEFSDLWPFFNKRMDFLTEIFGKYL